MTVLQGYYLADVLSLSLLYKLFLCGSIPSWSGEVKLGCFSVHVVFVCLFLSTNEVLSVIIRRISPIIVN